MAAPVTFVVPGVRADRGATRGAGGAAFPIGRAKDSITITAQRAAGESEVRTTAIPGEDVVVIEVAGGPELWLHPDTARDLLQSQHDPLLARGGAALAPGEVGVPARLRWRLEEGAPARARAEIRASAAEVDPAIVGDVLVIVTEAISNALHRRAERQQSRLLGLARDDGERHRHRYGKAGRRGVVLVHHDVEPDLVA